MPDGLLLIAVPVSSAEDVAATKGALEAVGVRHAHFAVREPGKLMASDHDRLADYFGEGWTAPLGLGDVELIDAPRKPYLSLAPAETAPPGESRHFQRGASVVRQALHSTPEGSSDG